MLTVDQLITSLTVDQVKAKLYAIADMIGLQTTAWQKLSPLRTIFAILAYLFSGFTVTQALVNRSGFLDFAAGDLLTLLAKYVYGVDRILATFATGQVTIINAAGGLYAFDPGDLILINSTSKKTYTNVDPVTILPLAGSMGGPPAVTIAISALEVGSASNSGPGLIDDFVAASPSLSVTNAASVIGDDAELDPDLVQRCRDSLGALSPMGPALAFAYVAKTPKLNGGVQNIRVLVRPAEGNGTMRVVVASASGVVPGPYTDPTTDLGKIFLALNTLAVPAGYTILLSSAVAHNITGDATIYIATSSGLSNTDAIAAATAAITAYVPTIPIGGVDVGSGGSVLYRALEAALKESAPGILEAKLSSELDIGLAATDVAVLTSATITAVQVVA